jgi:hypothetical protein
MEFLYAVKNISQEMTEIRRLLEVMTDRPNGGSTSQPGEGAGEDAAPPSQGEGEEGGGA